MIKFADYFILGPELDWLMEWWHQFGLNPVGIDPEVIEVGRMFLFHNRRLETIDDLFSEEENKMMFVIEKHPWIIRTKFVLHQDEENNEDPKLVRSKRV